MKRKQLKLPSLSPHQKTFSTPKISKTKKRKRTRLIGTKSASKYALAKSQSKSILTNSTRKQYKSPPNITRNILPSSASTAHLPTLRSPTKQHLISSAHEILPEFDRGGALTHCAIDEWVQTSQNQKAVHSKFQSNINFCKIKFAEIDSLTHHQNKLHSSRVRVFASLLKVFIESLCTANSNYSFIQSILKDLYRSLFIYPTVNDKELNLSSFKDANLYSEELIKIENMILNDNADLDAMRKQILKNRKRRSAHIVPAEKSKKPKVNRRVSVMSVRDFDANNLNESFGKKVTFLDELQDKICIEEDESSMDWDMESGMGSIMTKMSAIFLSKLHISSAKKCFIAWSQYVSRKKFYRQRMVTKYRGICSKRWFIRWRNHSKQQKYEKTANKLSETRIRLLKVENELSCKEKKYLHTIDTLKNQLNSILHRNDYDNTNCRGIDEEEKSQNQMIEMNKEWNRCISLHAMHVVEYKKKQFFDYLNDALTIDPCSIRFENDKNLTLPRNEYYKELTSKSTEDFILLWANTKLSNWFNGVDKSTKKYQKFSHFIGDFESFRINNFSKDWMDGRLYVILFHSIWPNEVCLNILAHSPIDRLVQICHFATRKGFNDGPFITPKNILSECSDLNFAFLGSALMNAPTPKASKCNFSRQIAFIERKFDRCAKLFRSAKVRNYDRMKQFLTEIEEIIMQIDEYFDCANQGRNVWIEILGKVSKQISIVLCHRFKNREPMHPNDVINSQILTKMSKISRNGLNGIEEYLLNDKDYSDLCVLMEQNVEEMRRVFDIYCNYHKGDEQTISALSWMIFARNLGITNKQFTSFKLREIFKQCSNNRIDRQLFAHSIVLIAAHKWTDFTKYKCLTDKVRVLLERHMKFTKNAKEMAYAKLPFVNVEDIFKEHSDSLKQIYSFYARSDGKDRGNNKKGEENGVILLDKPLKREQFSAMIKHAGLSEVSYSNQVSFLDNLVDQILNIMDSHISPHGAKELCFEEFLEMLATLCILKNPNPYTNLHSKLSDFLKKDVIEPIRGNVLKNKT